MRFGLVLGAGGVVGMSYHAGVLHALTEVAGLDPAAADLVVGTSAGSVTGALLRSGWTAEDCWRVAIGETGEQDLALLARWDRPGRMARRAVGSAYVAARSIVKAPVPPVPAWIARQFPAGIFDSHEMRDRIAEVLLERWPASPLWLVAVDVGSGRRVVFGRPGSPETTLPSAVMASCAIPALFPPVRIGGRLFVDGGAHSSTHLDLAATAGCDLIIGVAPMAFDPARAPGPARQLLRRTATRDLAREARLARLRGATVLLVRPGADELRVHGRDMLRPASTAAIARSAYESTARLLATPRFRRVIDGGGWVAA